MKGPPTLSHDQLNRATLARQRLLDHRRSSVATVLEAAAGLQAQEPKDPYPALFARVQGFRPPRLESMLQGRDAGRIALMRSTIHLVTARDALALRPLVQSAITRSYAGNHRKRLASANEEDVATAGADLLELEALSFSDLGRRLQRRWPRADAAALAQAVRAFVPLVQVPPRGLWSATGKPLVAPASAWFQGTKAPLLDGAGLVRRYLAAFGPASVADAQTWSGLSGLRTAFDALGGELVPFTSPSGETLFDLRKATRPDADTPAPPRFLPVYDNAILGYKDRRRILPARMPRLDLRVNESVRFVLVDGVLGATWNPEVAKRKATIHVAPFVPLDRETRSHLREEGEALLASLWREREGTLRLPTWGPFCPSFLHGPPPMRARIFLHVAKFRIVESLYSGVTRSFCSPDRVRASIRVS